MVARREDGRDALPVRGDSERSSGKRGPHIGRCGISLLRPGKPTCQRERPIEQGSPTALKLSCQAESIGQALTFTSWISRTPHGAWRAQGNAQGTIRVRSAPVIMGIGNGHSRTVRFWLRLPSRRSLVDPCAALGCIIALDVDRSEQGNIGHTHDADPGGSGRSSRVG